MNMTSWWLVAVAFLACGGSGAVGGSPARDVGALVETQHWPIVAASIGAGDGDHWLAGLWPDAVVMAGDREIERIPNAVVGPHEPFTALPGGRLAVGERILDRKRAVIYDAMARATREGRFGSVHAWGIDRAGTTAVIAASDVHGACLGGCNQKGPLRGEILRVALDGNAPVERVLDPSAGELECVVAAGPSAVAVADRQRLRVWPARGDGAATEVVLERRVERLIWADDGSALFAIRYVDIDHWDVIALDPKRGFAASRPWVIDGQVSSVALRPGRSELAIGTVPVPFHGHGGRIRIFGVDGSVHAVSEVDDGIPQQLAWSLDARYLLTALGRISPATGEVRRYEAR
jgi:hypothetical protein